MNTVKLWTRGNAHGLAWPGGAALLGDDVAAATAADLWRVMAEGGNLRDFLQALAEGTGAAWLALPPFAIAFADTRGEVRVAARGNGQVTVVTASDAVVVEGSSASTWSERRVQEAQSVIVTLVDGASQDGDGLPLISGMVPAHSITWTEGAAATPMAGAVGSEADEPAERGTKSTPEGSARRARASEGSASSPAHESPKATAAAASADRAGPPPSERPSESESPAPEEPESEPEPQTPHVADIEPEFAEAQPDAGPSFAQTKQEATPNVNPAGEQNRPGAPPPNAVAQHARDFDDELGGVWAEHTSMAPVEEAAVRESAESSEEQPQPAIVDLTKPIPVEPVTSTPETVEALDPSRKAYLDSLDLGDHMGDTIMQPAVTGGGGPQAPSPASAPAEIGVLSRRCPAGHGNPPHRAECRVCGVGLTGDTVRMERPVVGQMRVANGEAISLVDRVVVGRAPKAERFRGPNPPQLIAVPERHISAMHLEVIVDGWSVSARDMDSTNGTVLHRHGEEPRRLQGPSVLLAPGDVIDLGHGIHVQFKELP